MEIWFKPIVEEEQVEIVEERHMNKVVVKHSVLKHLFNLQPMLRMNKERHMFSTNIDYYHLIKTYIMRVWLCLNIYVGAGYCMKLVMIVLFFIHLL